MGPTYQENPVLWWWVLFAWCVLCFTVTFALRLRKKRKKAKAAKVTPLVRPDYRIFDMRKMNSWGNSAFWLESSPSMACIFSPQSPRVGDVVISRWNRNFTIVKVERMADPDDQFFVDTVEITLPLPERIPSSNTASEDFIF